MVKLRYVAITQRHEVNGGFLTQRWSVDLSYLLETVRVALLLARDARSAVRGAGHNLTERRGNGIIIVIRCRRARASRRRASGNGGVARGVGWKKNRARERVTVAAAGAAGRGVADVARRRVQSGRAGVAVRGGIFGPAIAHLWRGSAKHNLKEVYVSTALGQNTRSQSQLTIRTACSTLFGPSDRGAKAEAVAAVARTRQLYKAICICTIRH